MSDIPNTITLETIDTESLIVSAEHQANYTAIQTALNAIITALRGGTAGQVFTATDSDTVAWAAGAQTTAFGTSLPSNPADGDEYIYLAGAGPDVAWHLKFKASLNKWLFVGGAPLYAEVTTSETTTSTSYVALATPGPIVTVPLAGSYDVEIGLRGASTVEQHISYDIGGTGAVDADRCSTGDSSPGSCGSRRRRKTGLAASTALTAKYKTGAGQTGVFQDRFMAITPVLIDDV